MRNRGFSLIELIAVLVILGLLASIIGPRIVGWVSKSRTPVTEVQLSHLETGLEMFNLDIGRYPTTQEGLEALLRDPGLERWDGPYLKKESLPIDPWHRKYLYLSPGNHGDYDLWSLGADGLEGGDGENADITSW